MKRTSLSAGVAGLAAVAVLGPAQVASAAPTGPPSVTVLTHQAGADNADGDYFIAPVGGTASYQNGPEILDPNGNVVWFHPVPTGQSALDFRTQTYQGQPVLTWWQGVGAGGVGTGTDYIYDQNYNQIATVQAGNGYQADAHEFFITPQNTALITINATKTVDLTAIGGPANQKVTDGLVEEIDIATGQVLFEWDADANVPFTESQQPRPASASTSWDWFHINAVHLDTDGNLLIDARNTWTTYKVNRQTGAIIWKLGGNHSDFTEQAAPGQSLDTAGEIFSWQHDPEALGDDNYSFFSNESAGTANYPNSRAVFVHLDETAHTATLTNSLNQPHGLVATSQGDAQTAANGDTVVGWGSLPYFSEFDPAGNLVFDAQFPAGVNTYRAYRLPWSGAPSADLPEAPYTLGLAGVGLAAGAGVLVVRRRRTGELV